MTGLDFASGNGRSCAVRSRCLAAVSGGVVLAQAKKISKDFAVNRMLKGGEPGKIVGFWFDPFPLDKFRFMFVEADVGIGGQHLTQEVRLFLSGIIAQRFGSGGKPVAIAALLAQHFVVMWF